MRDAWNGSPVNGVVRHWPATNNGSAILSLALFIAYGMTFVGLGSKRGETLRIQGTRLRGQASETR